MTTIFTISVQEFPGLDAFRVLKIYPDPNISPELLGTITYDGMLYKAISVDRHYGLVNWQNFERALAYLISPRGMT